MPALRVLVVDDHDSVRKSICRFISTFSTLAVCGVASDGRDAIEKALLLHPDIVLMDLTMPAMGGLEATREIKRLQADTKIIIVSQHESPEWIRQAMNAGAAGYVTKSRVGADLLTEIEKASRHEMFEIVDPGHTKSQALRSGRSAKQSLTTQPANEEIR
jgi:DNA-binding NarL/FixJ family response regulator